MKSFPLWLLGALLLVSGCTSQRFETISGSQFVNYGDRPLAHTIYLGSDDGFHFFGWSHGKSSGRWRVPQDELIVMNPFPLGTREAFVFPRPNGRWCAYPCE